MNRPNTVARAAIRLRLHTPTVIAMKVGVPGGLQDQLTSLAGQPQSRKVSAAYFHPLT